MFSYQSAKKFLATLALTATAATVTTFTHYESKSVQISENVTSTEHSLSFGDKSANACVTLNPYVNSGCTLYYSAKWAYLEYRTFGVGYNSMVKDLKLKDCPSLNNVAAQYANKFGLYHRYNNVWGDTSYFVRR
jgi:exo-beta-1,3-glucanase (GH17 family)